MFWCSSIFGGKKFSLLAMLNKSIRKQTVRKKRRKLIRKVFSLFSRTNIFYYESAKPLFSFLVNLGIIMTIKRKWISICLWCKTFSYHLILKSNVRIYLKVRGSFYYEKGTCQKSLMKCFDQRWDYNRFLLNQYILELI